MNPIWASLTPGRNALIVLGAVVLVASGLWLLARSARREAVEAIALVCAAPTLPPATAAPALAPTRPAAQTRAIPSLDAGAPKEIETATFALG